MMGLFHSILSYLTSMLEMVASMMINAQDALDVELDDVITLSVMEGVLQNHYLFHV